MTTTLLLIILFAIAVVILILQVTLRPKTSNDLNSKIIEIQNNLIRIESNLKDEFKTNRDENASIAKENRIELNDTLNAFRTELAQTLKLITEQTHDALKEINETLSKKTEALTIKIDDNNQSNRDAMAANLKEFAAEQRTKIDELKKEQQELTTKTVDQLEKITNKVEEKIAALQNQAKEENTVMRNTLENVFTRFQETLDKNINSFNTLQKEKFEQMEIKQTELVKSTETKLEFIRVTVEEKLEKTLSDRLGQSFETVGKQLIEVQKGLGEMQTLAQDVGGLKKVLSNVKMRGGIGEVQLAMLLEQILAPDQYEANVKTKADSNDLVEFAIKLPGRDDNNKQVWLPVDAKFPKDVYEQLQTAYDIGDLTQIEAAQKALENTIKKMAKDISDKYLDPPNTTDFGIMFLPFEGIYAEVVRKASLLEELQRTYKVIVTGPTTLAAILNSLQMGFRTLAIQQRSSEVWKILGAVKKEFENFGGLMQKAQKNIQTGLDQLDDVMGKRTKAIQRKLRSVESLTDAETKLMLTDGSDDDDSEA
jgi:DNA recombination protein RmuC